MAFAFVDGSVGLLPDKIDCSTLLGLFLRNDGQGDRSALVDFTIAAPEPTSLVLLGRCRRASRSPLPASAFNATRLALAPTFAALALPHESGGLYLTFQWNTATPKEKTEGLRASFFVVCFSPLDNLDERA